MKTLILIITIFVASSNWSQAQVIYGSTPDQRKTGVYKSTWLIITNPEGENIQKPIIETKDADIQVKSCVSIDDGECFESEYFRATIIDVIG